ncbi:MAG: hypothetical protein ACREIR_06385 [Geminicoccaceae bacterium]
MPTTDPPGDTILDMIVSPTIWAIHFLLCYITAAIVCAKAQEDFGDVRLWIAVFTALALGGITYSGARAVRRGGFAYARSAPHDADTAADRRRFLAFATLLLSGLSFVATAFVALPALFFETCR